MSTDVDKLRSDADRAMKDNNFKLALDIYETLALRNSPDALLMCGLIREKGWDKTLLDLDKAHEFYRTLAIGWNADAGYLGCVRVILARHETQNREMALIYCRDVLKGEYKRDGYMNMGRIYEELFEPPQVALARRAYFRAFLSGSSLALRQYAISLMKSRRYVRGVAMHVAATVVAPFLVLLGGLGVTRKG